MADLEGDIRLLIQPVACVPEGLFPRVAQQAPQPCQIPSVAIDPVQADGGSTETVPAFWVLEVLPNRSNADGRQLVGVSHKHQLCLLRQGRQQCLSQVEIHHGGLINHEQIKIQGVPAVTAEAPWARFQEAVQGGAGQALGLRVALKGFLQASGCLAGGCSQMDAQGLAFSHGLEQHRLHGAGLPRPRAAAHHHQAMACDGLDGGPLLRIERPKIWRIHGVGSAAAGQGVTAFDQFQLQALHGLMPSPPVQLIAIENHHLGRISQPPAALEELALAVLDAQTGFSRAESCCECLNELFEPLLILW